MKFKKDPFDFERETLANGTEIFYQRIKNETEMRLLLKAGGARYDPIGKEGCAHILEHLIAKKTLHFPNEIARDDFVIEHNLEWNASCDEESLSLSGHCWGKKINSLFFLLGEILTNSQLEEEQLEEEKKVVMREMKPWQKIENWVKVELETKKCLFGSHPFSRIAATGGTPWSVNSLTLEDLIKHRKEFFVASNLSVTVLSNQSIKEIKSKVEEHFALPEGKIEYPRALEDFPKPAKNLLCYSRNEIFQSPKREQVGEELEMFAVIPTSKATFEWETIVPTLAEMLSRKLRYELSWIYGISVIVKKWRDVSLVRIGIDELPPGKGSIVRDLILKEISEFSKTKRVFEFLKKNELEKLKNYRGLPSRIASSAMKDIAIYDRPVTLREEIEKIENLDFEDAVDWLGRWLNEERILTRIIAP